MSNIEDVTQSGSACKERRQSEKASSCDSCHRNITVNMRYGYAYCRVVYGEGGAPADFVFEEVNSCYEDLTGQRGVAGQNASGIFSGIGKDQSWVIGKCLEVAVTGMPDRFELCLEPSQRWVECSVYSTRSGYFTLIVDDVTDRKFYERIGVFRIQILEMAATRTVEELLTETIDEAKRLTKSAVGFVFFVSKDEVSLTWRACSVHGSKKGTPECMADGPDACRPIGRNGVWAEMMQNRKALIHNDSAVFGHCRNLQEGLAGVYRELLVPIVREGKIVAVMGVANKQKPYDDHDVYWVGVLANQVWDITERKIFEEKARKLQEELQHAKKMEMVGHLAAGIAHEINNPLNFMQINAVNLEGYCADIRELVRDYRQIIEIMENGGEVADEVCRLRAKEKHVDIDGLLKEIPEMLEVTQKGLDRITAITRSMRSFSFMNMHDLQDEFDLNRVLNEAFVIERNEYCSVASIEVQHGVLPKVPGNPALINQVVLNLIMNSAQAIMSQKRGTPGNIRIRSWVEQDAVCFSISDDGPGIPEEIREQIFSPFFTTRAPGEGKGLGLSVAYDIIVQKHHGTFSCECPPEGGTVFTITLPLKRGEW